MQKLLATGLEVRGDLTKKDIAKALSWFDLKEQFDATGWQKGFLEETVARWSPTYLKKVEGKPTSMPFEARLVFKPRHGDILLKFDAEDAGYRNNIVWFWHEELGAVECDFDADEYGGVPHYFAFPRFPLDYYLDSMAHNNIVQVDLRGARISRAYGEKSVAINFDHPDITFKVQPWDDEDVTTSQLWESPHGIAALEVEEHNGNTVVCHHRSPNQ